MEFSVEFRFEDGSVQLLDLALKITEELTFYVMRRASIFESILSTFSVVCLGGYSK